MTSVVRHTSTTPSCTAQEANTCQYRSNDAPAARQRALLRHAQRWAAMRRSLWQKMKWLLWWLMPAAVLAQAQPAATDDARPA